MGDAAWLKPVGEVSRLYFADKVLIQQDPLLLCAALCLVAAFFIKGQKVHVFVAKVIHLHDVTPIAGSPFERCLLVPG